MSMGFGRRARQNWSSQWYLTLLTSDENLASGISVPEACSIQTGIDLELTRMKKYVCNVCGYIYNPEEGDPDGGIAPGTLFEDIPDDWVCPTCGATKEDFEEE